MDNWQPIETAPTDGETILVCNAEKMVAVVVAWTGQGFGSRELGFMQATHWMPLPKPPVTA